MSLPQRLFADRSVHLFARAGRSCANAFMSAPQRTERVPQRPSRYLSVDVGATAFAAAPTAVISSPQASSRGNRPQVGATRSAGSCTLFSRRWFPLPPHRPIIRRVPSCRAGCSSTASGRSNSISPPGVCPAAASRSACPTGCSRSSSRSSNTRATCSRAAGRGGAWTAEAAPHRQPGDRDAARCGSGRN